MNADDIYTRAIDWAWALVAGAAMVLGRAFVRIYRHEERIKSLEQTRDQHASALADLTEKVDSSHQATRTHIDSRFEEVRDDLRIIMGRCLSISHDK